MKKNLTRYLSAFAIILVLAAGALISVCVSRKNSATAGTASIANISPLGTVGKNAYYEVQAVHWPDGTCANYVFWVDANGNRSQTGTYYGTWGGDECRIALPQVPAPTIPFSSAVSAQLASSANAYMGSQTGIISLQLKLVTEKILDPSKVDGIYSQDTFNAIQNFQTKNNIPRTGFLDSATLTALNMISVPKPTTSANFPFPIAPPPASPVPPSPVSLPTTPAKTLNSTLKR